MPASPDLRRGPVQEPRGTSGAGLRTQQSHTEEHQSVVDSHAMIPRMAAAPDLLVSGMSVPSLEAWFEEVLGVLLFEL
jgi:hypothetical protein